MTQHVATFGDRLRLARRLRTFHEGAEIRQEEIATKLGVTPGAVSHWETDRKEPTLSTIRALAELLRVRPGWLAFGDGPMTQGPISRPAPPTSLQGGDAPPKSDGGEAEGKSKGRGGR